MRGQQLVKLFRAIELFSKPAGTTIKELQETFGINRSSANRIIRTMENLGFPLYDEKLFMEKEKRWKFDETYLKRLPNINVPDLKLELPEIIALYLIKGEARLYRRTEIEKKVNTVFAKLGAFVPTELVEKLDRIKTLFVSSENFAKDYSGKEEIIDSLTDAMLQQKTSYVKYHSFAQDRISNFTIDPLYFFESQGGLYVFVRATSFDEIRILAVERIQELTLTENHFEYPDDFDPDEKLNEAFDMVYDDPIEAKIWISSSQARYVTERRLVKNQKVTNQEDGSIILDIKTSGWWDLKRWILSFGGNAEVLEPIELREEIANEIKTLNNTYSDC